MVSNPPGTELPTSVPGTVPNGVWTVIGPRGHRTVKVETVDKPGHGLHGKRIVSVMSGPDNLFDYTGVAFLETKFEPTEIETQVEEVFEHEHDDCFDYRQHIHSVSKKETVMKPVDFLVVWHKQRGTDLHKTAAAWLRIITDGIEGYRFDLAKHCIKCNRLLTNPESIDAGIGPICAQGGIDSD